MGFIFVGGGGGESRVFFSFSGKKKFFCFSTPMDGFFYFGGFLRACPPQRGEKNFTLGRESYVFRKFGPGQGIIGLNLLGQLKKVRGKINCNDCFAMLIIFFQVFFPFGGGGGPLF